MPRIAIIGPPSVIRPFQALGIELLPAEDAGAARERLRTLGAELDAGVVFLTDDLADACRPAVEALRQKPAVAVLVLPNPAGGAAAGAAHYAWVREKIKRAVGLDLLGGERAANG